MWRGSGCAFRSSEQAEALPRRRQQIGAIGTRPQEAAIRHVGPTAQDFHAAFGLGEDPLRISTVNADGIALRAIQALEARTRAHRARLQLIEQELETRAAPVRR